MKMIGKLAFLIYDGECNDAIKNIDEFESTIRRIESFEASFLLSQTGSNFTNIELLTLLFDRGGRMTEHFVNTCLRDTVMHKKNFTKELTEMIASHFATDQIQDALNWFDSDTGFPLSAQHKYCFLHIQAHAPFLPKGIVPEYPTFRANPDACATESSFRILTDSYLDAYNGDDYAIYSAEKYKAKMVRTDR
jgi:hypothetical protein